ncbi:MAG TPA: hypothetical protein VMI74_00255 [Burkholderiales bacterium]|nr:hypothetical protein [Burkholderiales bacterium]
MRHGLNLASVISIAFATCALAQKTPNEPPGPCKEIANACRNAGFIKGDWKKGDGLWRDCVDPIMQGKSTAPGATKPLPQVDPSLVSACKAKHPKYGGGKVGS